MCNKSYHHKIASKIKTSLIFLYSTITYYIMKPKFKLAVIVFFVCCVVSFNSCNQIKSSSSQTDFLDKKGIDSSVRPQDDFFHYVNGTWIKNTEIPASESAWGAGSILISKYNAKLKKFT